MKEDKISTNSELAEGLKMAMSKGESLGRAKTSLLNAGYKVENVDAAAKLLGIKEINLPKPEAQKTTSNQIQPKFPDFKLKFLPQKVIQNVSRYEPPKEEVVKSNEENISQKVSDYEKPESKPNKKMIVFLVALLILLGVALVLILLYREPLVEFFGGFF